MSEQNQPIDISEDIEVVGPGQMLREARESRGLSQKDVATHLNFRLALVNELETESFDSATPTTFLRGYLRNYAKFLGLNEKDVLASYETLGVARQQRAEMKSFSRSTAKKAENKLLMVSSTVIAALMIGVSVYHFIMEDSGETQVVGSGSTVETKQDDIITGNVDTDEELHSEAPVAEASGERVASNSTNSEMVALSAVSIDNDTAQTGDNGVEAIQPEASQDSNEVMQEETLASVAVINAEPANSNDVSASDEESLASAVTGQIPAADTQADLQPVLQAELKFVFSGDCWVNIFDADGNRLAWGIKKNDYVMTLTGKPPFNVTLGKPELVQMSYQGENVSLSQYKVGQIAKMLVPEPVVEEAAE
ncbi:RodZ domain-containing protein [Thalassotalea sp. PS06]|uniref:RodZ domain-containing protein n=1 Tax=Thalassotalea sp. PS06 TaxID=2594005 RepID=UPI0011649F33|nr:RodZ domain-containing protein [Thalassotalea sp. PS06]QDP00388.1 DUF4115 domain-containing protein [Thalassotalea sp. PS06]